MKKTLSAIASFLLLSFIAAAQKDSLAFGDKNWNSHGLEGKIYFLPEGTDSLPDFDSLKSQGSIYTSKIDVPNQSWENGFPGVSKRFEWFGIEYKANFKVKKAGHYTFNLASDDGSKLFIDDKLVINNDGLHSVSEASGEIDLDRSAHSIVLQYYQGPRNEIALQLFYSYNKGERKIFSAGEDFALSTPGHSWWVIFWWIIIMIIILFLIIFFWMRRRKRSRLAAPSNKA